MYKIIKAEITKLKRYHVLLSGLVLMFLSVVLTLFTSLAKDGSVWDFKFLIEQVIKNNMSMIFPMCITLISGYIIDREEKDDTLKNILTIPISLQKLLLGKIVVCGLISLILGVVCFGFTILAQLALSLPGFSLELFIQSFFQITMLNLFLYIAVLPIIVIASNSASGLLSGVIIAFVYGYGGMFAAGNMTLANLYPISAALGLIGYRSYATEVNWNYKLCLMSLMFMILIAMIYIFLMKKRYLVKVSRKVKPKPIKKGW